MRDVRQSGAEPSRRGRCGRVAVHVDRHELRFISPVLHLWDGAAEAVSRHLVAQALGAGVPTTGSLPLRALESGKHEVLMRMERDDVRTQLELIRRRREEAVRVDADLALHQAALEARLAELTDEAAGDPAARRLATTARLELLYGPTRSTADLVEAIHTWRRHIPSVGVLSMEVSRERDHLRGDPGAPVVVVEYGDYQCTECAQAHELHDRVRPWLDDGRLCVVFRHFPLVDAHPIALRAAQAAEAAAAQGRFWEMHDALMEMVGSPHSPPARHRPALVLERQLEHAARRGGLDIERFRIDVEDPGVLERVLEDFRSGLASGVNGTPTFYVNGRRAEAGAVEELYAQIAAASAASPSAAPSPGDLEP